MLKNIKLFPSFVFPQIISLVTRISAHITNKRFLSSMSSQVDSQPCLLTKFSLALITFKPFIMHSITVLVPQSNSWKSFVTEITAENLLVTRGVKQKLMVLTVFKGSERVGVGTSWKSTVELSIRFLVVLDPKSAKLFLIYLDIVSFSVPCCALSNSNIFMFLIFTAYTLDM